MNEYPQGVVDYILEKGLPDMKKDVCVECGEEVKVAIFKGSGACSEKHRKLISGETNRPSALVDAGVTNILNQPRGEVTPGSIR